MYYFIVNLAGGGGRGASAWKSLREILQREKIEYKAFRTRHAGDAGVIAHRLTNTDDTKIRDLIVVGGDGTINEVLNGIEDLSRVRLGIIPCGSGNDLARGLGIPKDVEQAWKRIKLSDGFDIDVGELMVRDRIADAGAGYICHRFCISAGVGLDAIVCKKVSQTKLKALLNMAGFGSLSYILVTIINLFAMETSTMKLMIRDGDNAYEKILKDSIFMAAMNLRAEGGGVKMSPDARYDDGKLSICNAHGIPKWKAFFLLPFVTMGKHKGKSGFFLENGEEFVLSMQTPMTVHADGEYMGEHRELIFRTGEKTMKVL